MKRLALMVLGGVIATACSGSMPAGPGPIAAGPASAATDGKPSTGVPKNWVAHLVGTNEVPSRETRAQGQVKFQLSADGTELSWRLISSNIDNVVAAHIHIGAPGTNGGFVLFLYGNAPAGGGAQDGVLSSGVAHASDLVNALVDQPLSALIAAMDSGNAYVNVHTNDGQTGSNTGPGDFSSGEIRGQIERAGH